MRGKHGDKHSEAGAKRFGTKPSRSSRSKPASQAGSADNLDAYPKANASRAYHRTKQHGFDRTGATAMQDWLEAGVEIDAAQDVNGIDYRFLTRQYE
jgi:hypothetical protein